MNPLKGAPRLQRIWNRGLGPTPTSVTAVAAHAIRRQNSPYRQPTSWQGRYTGFGDDSRRAHRPGIRLPRVPHPAAPLPGQPDPDALGRLTAKPITHPSPGKACCREPGTPGLEERPRETDPPQDRHRALGRLLPAGRRGWVPADGLRV